MNKSEIKKTALAIAKAQGYSFVKSSNEVFKGSLPVSIACENFDKRDILVMIDINPDLPVAQRRHLWATASQNMISAFRQEGFLVYQPHFEEFFVVRVS